jgi:transcriptional regulator with XRE-family HTH domain
MSTSYGRTLDRWFHRPRRCDTQRRVARRKPTVGKRRADPVILRSLGQQLRRLRLEREMSQEALAELSGLNYKHIGRIELGKTEPGTDVLVRLARALSVPVGELFETITPGNAPPPPVRVTEVEDVSAALATLTEAVNRLRASRPRPLPARAPRRPSR